MHLDYFEKEVPVNMYRYGYNNFCALTGASARRYASLDALPFGTTVLKPNFDLHKNKILHY